MKHTTTRRRKSNTSRLLTLLIVAALLFGLFYAIWALGNSRTAELPLDEAETSVTQKALGAGHALPLPAAFSATAPLTELTDTGYLKLVNREHAITHEVDPGTLVPVWPTLTARTADQMLHPTAMDAIEAAFAAAAQAGMNNLILSSGFRGYEEQHEWYANTADAAFVVPPGHSEHHLGLAADIMNSPEAGTMPGSVEAAWLAEHAPRFGLILRYPEDKQDITGVPYEPWHFRYVGRVHAWYMDQHNFVLEEYIAYLQTHGGFQTMLDGRTYYVLYQRPQNDMIFVPEDLEFTVSGANTGGYIVTAWR